MSSSNSSCPSAMPTRMYAKVRKASSPRVEPTASAIDGSSVSIAATMSPIGSSTSGSQISSTPATRDRIRRSAPGAPRAPADLRGDDEHERAEAAAEDVFVHRGGRPRAGHDADRGGDADDERRTPAHVPVARLVPRARRDRREDGEERGRLGLQLPETEREQRGHEENAAADPEEAGEHAGAEAERDGKQG